jgi:hypothetical protein
MAGARRAFSQITGGIQCGLGTLATVFAFLVYASPSMRAALNVATEEVYLYMFLFLIFGIFSILSGLLLVCEER